MRGAIGMIAVLGVLGIGMWWAGWLSIDSTETQTQIQIDKQEIKQDTQESIEAGKRLVNEIDRNVDVDVGEDVDRDGNESNANRADQDDVDVDVNTTDEPLPQS